MPRVRLPLAEVPACIAALPRGRHLTLIGLAATELRGLAEAIGRPLLQVAARPGDARAQIDGILDDLAALALAAWPAWAASDEALAPWRRAAARLAAAALRPRFRHTPRETELAQLRLAIDPALVLVAAIDGPDPHGAVATITALEWCRDHGTPVVILCPARPPDTGPWDRIAYGALEVTRAPQPVADRLIVPTSARGSAIERRLRDALAADAELGRLFAHEVVLCPNALGLEARVDLLWAEGRVVVEIDGPEHCIDPKFGLDRHRDYELLVAGYLVLRLTNTQVATDLQHAIEKVRQVVRFRRRGGLP